MSADATGPLSVLSESEAGQSGGNSLIELLVFGRIVGQAAASYSASLTAHLMREVSVAGNSSSSLSVGRAA